MIIIMISIGSELVDELLEERMSGLWRIKKIGVINLSEIELRVKVIDAFESQPEEDGGVREERVRRGGE
jgi:hypothetical protein